MPQMRAVMSGASVNSRPRRNASKKRGGSKIAELDVLDHAVDDTSTCIAPSPSTRAR